jgi:hypothetical protein
MTIYTEETFSTAEQIQRFEEVISQQTSTIENLQRALENRAQQCRSHEQNEETLKELLIEEHENIDEGIIDSICSIFGIELTREVYVEGVVPFSGYLTLPVGYDPDDIQGEISAEVSIGWQSDIEGDLDVDDIEVTVTR